MIEYIVIGAIAYLFGCVCFLYAWPVFVGQNWDDLYIPDEDYAEDFAARLSGQHSAERLPGGTSPESADPFPADSGDIIDMRRLGTGPRGSLQHRTTPVDASLGRSAAEKDRPTLYVL